MSWLKSEYSSIADKTSQHALDTKMDAASGNATYRDFLKWTIGRDFKQEKSPTDYFKGWKSFYK